MKSEFVIALCAVATAGAARSTVCGQGVALPAAPAGVEVTHSQGYEFVTVGPAARQTTPAELTNWEAFGGQLGGVQAPYRMARTEVTVGDWFQFVQSYAPYHSGFANDPAFTGLYIWTSANDSAGHPIYQMVSGSQNYPTVMGWRYAAIFCNWLTNDRAITQGAFTSGAYDTSTFTNNEDGTVNDATTHQPGARFWIPSQNEWTQAVFYDPNRYGPGQPGYWSQPNGSDTGLVPGLPGSPGSQTSAGVPALFNTQANVGSYSAMSPWGLLDVSGGAREWLENPEASGAARLIRGSATGRDGGELLPYTDSINWLGQSPIGGGVPGLRLAASIPSPSAAFLLLGATCCEALSRRRR